MGIFVNSINLNKLTIIKVVLQWGLVIYQIKPRGDVNG